MIIVSIYLDQPSVEQVVFAYKHDNVLTASARLRSHKLTPCTTSNVV